MEIEDSPIYKEIKEIIEDGPKPISYYYKALVHADGNDYEVVKCIQVNTDADYVTKISEIVKVRVMITLGLWAKKIYPFRTDLEVTLKRIPLIEAGDEQEEDEEIETQRFIASPVPDTMPNIDGKDIEKLTMEELDNRDMLEIEFQLTNKVIHKLRLITVGGIYRRCTPEDALKLMLTQSSKKAKGDDEESFKGVDVVKPDNKELREHYVIPHATKIVDLPVYFQRRCGGLYSSGIGTFFTKGFWFIYPLWDTTRGKSAKTLNLIKVPVHRHTGLERTYREEGDTIYIIGTSDSEIMDDSMTQFSDTGNGVRFSDSRKHIRDFVKTSGNKAIANRKEMNHEFTILDRKGKNATFESPRFSNSNPYVERSELAAKRGGWFRMNWENSNSSLVFPGMMCKIHYLSNNKVKEITGVLLGHESAVQLDNRGITSTRHKTSTVLTIFINPPPDEEPPEDPDEPISDWTKYEAI